MEFNSIKTTRKLFKKKSLTNVLDLIQTLTKFLKGEKLCTKLNETI